MKRYLSYYDLKYICRDMKILRWATPILAVLAKYDSDKKFPTVGFGAKYDGVVQHCFQCGDKAEAAGVDGVLEAYHQVFKQGLIMSSPTVFMEVIETASARPMWSRATAESYGMPADPILLFV